MNGSPGTVFFRRNAAAHIPDIDGLVYGRARLAAGVAVMTEIPSAIGISARIS
jgi:hypothetical protein